MLRGVTLANLPNAPSFVLAVVYYWAPTLVIGGHFNAGHIKREGASFKFMALG